MKHSVVSLVFILIFQNFAFSQSAISVREGEDALIFHIFGDPSGNRFTAEKYKNYGDRIFLITSQWTWEGSRGEQEILIKFNIPELKSKQIESAYINLFGYTINSKYTQSHSTLSPENDITIHRIITPWNESEVTWESKPEISPENIVNAKGTVIPDENLENIDITQLLKDTYDNPKNSYGFLIKLKTPERYRQLVFSSFEDDEAVRPELIINYTGKIVNKKFYKDTKVVKTVIEKSNEGKEIKKKSKNTYTLVIYDETGKEIQRIENIEIKKSEKPESGIYNFNIIKKKNTIAGGKMIIY